jgi:hypothetical protein
MSQFDEKPTDVSKSEFLQLLGLESTPVILDPKMFKDGKVPEPRGIEVHLVYDHRTLGPGMVSAATTRNRDADEAFGLGTDLLLNPDGEAVFLFEREDGEIEAIALTNPYKHGKTVQYRQGDTQQFREERIPPGPWCPHASINAVDYDVPVEVPAGEDPHIHFYLAAHQLRDRIATDTAKLTKGMSESAVLATTVFTPIIAMPKPDKGFYIHCSIGQMVFAKSSICDEGHPINRKGEIPIERPNAVTMTMLMHMDKELEAMGVISKDRNKPKVLPSAAVKEAFRRGARQGLHVEKK